MSTHTIEAPNVSLAWLQAVQHILHRGGECLNLMVTIENPLNVEQSIHKAYEELLFNHGLLTLKQVTYTIFPRSLYLQVDRDANRLFESYNRNGGVYARLRSRYRQRFRWGSYFRRMTHYPVIAKDGHPVIVNQLGDIISMLQKRTRLYKAAYTISIQIPGVDGRTIMGGPCLNYIALQLQSHTRTLSLLAVYRNHDFIQRAYGNYLGLGYLMEFLCDQTGCSLGRLNCLSSHASIANIAGTQRWPTNERLNVLLEGLDTNEDV